ncbi:MAG TPA: methyltransferase domain-containing protein [Draconibacterium sp.]|nr:methyltransferase domain-containing protein [Draconibacterium sp.]
MNNKIYPDSGVELTPFISRHYDGLMNTLSFGLYRGFIQKAIREMNISEGSHILDLGCGTGRNAALMAKYIGDEGSITGLDISPDMESQFLSKFDVDKQVSFINQRIDQPFDLGKKFDIVFISFVIHGFPHPVRQTVIENVLNHLKPGGRFIILDFAEFDMAAMPPHHRFVFKSVECKYAFDYIERDWKKILEEAGFSHFNENFYLKKYVRLLQAAKQ